jgi:hypothetical protein
MPAPDSLEIPIPENLPLMDAAFRLSSVADYDWDMQSWPGMIGDELIQVFNAVEPMAMSTILELLQPAMDGVVVKNAQELAQYVLTYKHEIFGEGQVEDPEGFTDEHLQVYVLQRAHFARHVDWRILARLFNASTPEQKQAIDAFMWDLRRISLETLFSKKSMELAVPAVLYERNEVRHEGGDTFIRCTMTNDWLRDDEFYRQFRVLSNEAGNASHSIIGFAGTLEQAIAKASLYAMQVGTPAKKDWNGVLAGLAAIGGVAAAITIYHDQLMVSADHKAVGTTGNNGLSWGKVDSPIITEKQFRSALYATEKLLGVQWSKVNHLEDALGL